MKDIDARGLVLQFLYDCRKRPFYPDDGAVILFPEEGPDEFHRICKQLAEVGLIDWEERNIPSERGGWVVRGDGIQLTALGIDRVESGGKDSPIPFILPTHQTVYIQNSQGFQVGNHNSQSLIAALEYIIQGIDNSNAQPEEKEQAKGKLKTALEHPLVGSIVGSSIAALIGLLK